jgi:molecular chaperone GrpE
MSSADEPERVVIRDNRKIDPLTGEARKPAGPAGDESPAVAAGDATAAEDASILDSATVELLAERTADLQRLQAEYANYRKRADRERLAAGEVAIGAVLTALLPVLDNIDRAREHGDLTAGLKAVADQLADVFGKLGLKSFGALGDPFDPAIHEAVLHDESDTVTEPTVTTLMRQGYTHGERLLRPAMVGVSDPAAQSEPTPQAEPEAEAQGDSAVTDE